MPIYEYECGRCGIFEHSQRITDAALTKCPTCRRKVRRIISSTSFQLKGSGWYVTDYARSGADGKKDQAGKDAGSESKAEAKSDTTSESKSSKSSDSKSDTKSASKASSSTTAKAS